MSAHLANTAAITAAYLKNNQVPVDQLDGLLRSVHGALNDLTNPPPPPAAERGPPAVAISRSITPDFIICLEDGKPFKSMKRHLRQAYGLTPEEYRRRWNLRPDYPMVSPNYAAVRSKTAKEMGLGRGVRIQPKRR